ncbi:hypothetical protein Q0P26_13820, partial [Staphylococcus aureus]|nr:hypothetical protein [Staphylococcus aureus]
RVAAGLLARAQSGGSGESLPEAVTRAISATGAQARDLLVRQARAAWAAADLDAASTQAEAALALPAPGLGDDAVEVASAVWSARDDGHRQ